MIPLLLHLPRVLRSDMRRIYRTAGIRIDLWRHRLRGLRGAELKHHLVDRDSAGGFCSESNRDDAIEIGAASLMVAGARFGLWKRPLKFEFLLTY